MTDKTENESEMPPVYVIEAIPTGGEHEVSAREVESERIPIPAHLRVSPELGMVAWPACGLTTICCGKLAPQRRIRRLACEPMYRMALSRKRKSRPARHFNILPVHGSPHRTGIPYFTMKLVQAMGLDKWLRDPSRRAGTRERLQDGLDIFLKVCDAVAYAHHRGVVHRDLKPENIMVASFGRVYVIDWGLARLTKTRPASGDFSQMEARKLERPPMCHRNQGGQPSRWTNEAISSPRRDSL